MSTRIQKWGNSYAVRLPKGTIERLNLREGHEVCIAEHEDGSGISILPVGHEALSLAKLAALITPKNQHDEAAFGEPVGTEVW